MNAATTALPTRLPPGPRGLPLFGSLLDIRHDTHLAIDRLAKRYGDICLLRFGSVPTVVISDADLLHEAFGKAVLADRWVSEIMDALSGQKDLVLAPYGEHWRQMQRFANRELLSARNVDNVRARHIEQVVDGLVAQMAEMGDAGELVSPPLMTARSNATLMFRSIFGQPEDATDEFLQQRETLLQYISWIFSSATSSNLADYIPWLRFLPNNAVKEAVRQAEIGSAIIRTLVDTARNRPGLDLSSPTLPRGGDAVQGGGRRNHQRHDQRPVHGLDDSRNRHFGADGQLVPAFAGQPSPDPSPGARGTGPRDRTGHSAHHGRQDPAAIRVCIPGRVHAVPDNWALGTPPQGVGRYRTGRLQNSGGNAGAGQHLLDPPTTRNTGIRPMSLSPSGSCRLTTAQCPQR